MITHARLMHLGVPALKVRRFASTIKGEKVDRALAILDLQPSPTCQKLSKLLRSAIANAVNNHQMSAEYLYVSNVQVDQGPTMKRIRPRARGRAYRVLKRSSHVTIELDLAAQQEQKTAATTEEPTAKKSRSRRKPAAAQEKKPEAKTVTKAKTEEKAAEKKPARSKSTAAKEKKSEKPAARKKSSSRAGKQTKKDDKE